MYKFYNFSGETTKLLSFGKYPLPTGAGRTLIPDVWYEERKTDRARLRWTFGRKIFRHGPPSDHTGWVLVDTSILLRHESPVQTPKLLPRKTRVPTNDFQVVTTDFWPSVMSRRRATDRWGVPSSLLFGGSRAGVLHPPSSVLYRTKSGQSFDYWINVS